MAAMSGYTKLFNSILASTVWREPMEVRIVWITLLAMADKDGIAEGSVPGLADFARIPVEATRKAIARLSAPDPDSRSQEHEGRRIQAIDGGWQLLNHAKYRAKMGLDERREYNRLKQAQYRSRLNPSITVNDNVRCVDNTEAEAEAKPVVVSNKTETVPGKPGHSPIKEKNKVIKNEAIEALRFLNEKTGKAYREVDTNLKLIESILKSGVSLEDIRTVTMRKVRDWRDNPKMAEYLRPSTLYRCSNFEQYLGQTILPEEPSG